MDVVLVCGVAPITVVSGEQPDVSVWNFSKMNPIRSEREIKP